MKVDTLNRCTFSGIILGIEDDRNGCLMFVRQTVVGRFDTVLAVYILPRLKKEFLALHLEPGDYVHIVDAEMYQKDNVVRIRITDIRQIPKIPEFNSMSISGVITEIVPDDGHGTIYKLKQRVAGKIDTVYDIFVPKKVGENLEEKFSPGDHVMVLNALLYSKDGLIRFKIEHPLQMQKMHETFFLKEEEAKEKFI